MCIRDSKNSLSIRSRWAHRDRIDKLFLNFDKNGDGKLSKKELQAVKQEMKKRIYKFRNEGN